MMFLTWVMRFDWNYTFQCKILQTELKDPVSKNPSTPLHLERLKISSGLVYFESNMLEKSEVMAAKFYGSLCMAEVQTCPLTTENVYKISQPLLCVYFQPLSLSNWQLCLFWGAHSSGINVFPLICPSQKVKNLGGEEIRRLVTFCIHVLFLLGYSIK